MRLSKLHAVAHNYADSLSGGLSFVVPKYVLLTSIYAEAAPLPDGIVVDLLHGTVKGAFPGGQLEQVVPLFSAAFPAFCARHGVDHSQYSMCMVRFFARLVGNSYIITVGDQRGFRSAREYVGSGKRSMEMDRLGRLRPKIIASPET
jgi:hypothetical protein